MSDSDRAVRILQARTKISQALLVLKGVPLDNLHIIREVGDIQQRLYAIRRELEKLAEMK